MGFAEDPYATLGVRHTATASEIRTAYKKLALQTHPDKTDDDGAMFRAVQAAYEVLSAGSSSGANGTRYKSQWATKRDRAARDEAAAKAAQKASFEEKARQFVARQQAKKREYDEARAKQGERHPLDEMQARHQERLDSRYKKMQDEHAARRKAKEGKTPDEPLPSRRRHASGLEPGRTRGPLWQRQSSAKSSSTPAAFGSTVAPPVRAAQRVFGASAHDAPPPLVDAVLVERALAFLTHPRSDDPLEARVEFLRRQQRMNDASIAAALERIAASGAGGAAAAAAAAAAADMSPVGVDGLEAAGVAGELGRSTTIGDVSSGESAWWGFGFFNGAPRAREAEDDRHREARREHETVSVSVTQMQMEC